MDKKISQLTKSGVTKKSEYISNTYLNRQEKRDFLRNSLLGLARIGVKN